MKSLAIIILFCFSFNTLYAETIPSNHIKIYAIGEAFTFNDDRTVMEETWQKACIARKMYPTNASNARYCLNEHGNAAAYPMEVDICSDGTFKIPGNAGWCEKIIPECPNSSWKLSEDKSTCTRIDDICWKDLDHVSEVKLLAAIIYGESHASEVYEEMAGIASAIIRHRDAGKFNTVADLVRKQDGYSYVVYNKNERFINLMCRDEKDFKIAYDAARNALNYGPDYSSGACFWDGYDLKTKGSKHYTYRVGFRYTDPSHNIFSTPQPPHKERPGRKGGFFSVTFVSTTTQGRTIFWKLDTKFLEANGAVQCN